MLRFIRAMSYPPGTEGVTGGAAARGSPRLLDAVRARLRFKHYSLRTERAYIGWIRRFILANGKRHPREMGASGSVSDHRAKFGQMRP